MRTMKTTQTMACSGAVVAAANGAPPADEKIEVATKTAKRLAEVANFMTKTHLDLTEKWLNGSLSFGDSRSTARASAANLRANRGNGCKNITTAAQAQ